MRTAALCIVAVPIITLMADGCAFMYFDETTVNVYPRESNIYAGTPTRYVTQQWGENLSVSYDSRISDIREKRYAINIGKNVFDRYQRDENRAVHDVTERVMVRRSLCAKGWSLVSQGVSHYSGGIGWTVMCNE